MSESYQAGVSVTRLSHTSMGVKEHATFEVSVTSDTELEALLDLRDVIAHRIERAEDKLRVWGMDKQIRVMRLLDAVTPNGVSPASLIDRALQHPQFINQQNEPDDYVADWIRNEFVIKPEQEAIDQKKMLLLAGARRTSTVYGAPTNTEVVSLDESHNEIEHPDESEWADRQGQHMPAEQH